MPLPCLDSVMDCGFLVGTAELRGEGLACPFVAGWWGRWGGSQGSPEPDEQNQSLSFPCLRRESQGHVTGQLPRPWHPAVPTHPDNDLLPGQELGRLMVTGRQSRGSRGPLASLVPQAGPAGTPHMLQLTA